MDFIETLQMGSERAVADMVIAMIGNDPVRFEEVFTLTFTRPYPINMRAARAIQLCCEKNPRLIYPHLSKAMDVMLHSKIDGVKRNFLKIFAEFIPLEDIGDPGLLLDTCFHWLMDTAQNPALCYYCMDFIARMVKKEPDLRYELEAVIEIRLQYDKSPSFRNKAGKIAKFLAQK